jgi:hypothetical protein
LNLAFGAKIKTDTDKNADFASYKTYAWGKNLEPQRAGAKILLTGAIEDQLNEKGLQQQDVAQADLIVRYQAAGDTDMNFSATMDPTYAAVGGIPLPGTTVWTSGFNVSSNGRYIRKGTLVIDVFDRRQHKLIWSASAAQAIPNDPEKAINQVSKTIAEMLNKYPVQNKK